MLKELRVQNLILISSASIHFDDGFNVLSGETGAGKSAIMKALSLLNGEKTDASVIRHGADKAIVEGFFDIDNSPAVLALLEELQISHETQEDLILRREISAAGKSRCMINSQAVQLNVLKKIGNALIEMVGQHANQKLLSLEHHRQIVDLFGDLQEDVREFSRGFEQENKLIADLENLIKNESQRLREIETCRMELEELEEANLKEGEDEELFLEYSRLVNADEISTGVQEIHESLSGEKQSVLTILKRNNHLFEQLSKLDNTFSDVASSHKNALMELQEVAYTLAKLGGKIEHNPERLHTINDRLGLINKLKRKYGATIPEIRHYIESLRCKLEKLESADEQIEAGQQQLAHLQTCNNEQSAQLTKKRQFTANKLGEELTSQLRSLNMPKVQFEIDVIPQKRTSCGDDQIEFFLVPNVGEKRIPIKEHASGGELSRILLALQTLLVGKEDVAVLIFDEIDANIGGATAVVIGEKLREIGRRHQVLCITHFPQVAKQAEHHIYIEKQEKDGRTFSQITRLDPQGRQKELGRMAGHL